MIVIEMGRPYQIPFTMYRLSSSMQFKAFERSRFPVFNFSSAAAHFEESKVHELLNNIPVGKMSARNLYDAKELMSKWCGSNTYQDALRVEAILNRLLIEQRDGGNPSIHIPTSIYSSLLQSYAKMDPSCAHNFLQQMILTKGLSSLPDIECYNTVLHGWAESNHPDALEKMERIVSSLEENIKSDIHPQPNTITYNNLMNAYANRSSVYGYAQKAEDLLLKMANMNTQNNSNVRPNTSSFNIVLKAWKNCHEGIECAQRAESILSLMTKLESQNYHVRPDTISFCTVINAYGENIRVHEKLSPCFLDDMSASLDGAIGVIDTLIQSSTVSDDGVCSNVFSMLIVTIGRIGQQAIVNSRTTSEASDRFRLLGDKYFSLLDRIKLFKSQGLISETVALNHFHSILDNLQQLTKDDISISAECRSCVADEDRFDPSDPLAELKNNTLRRFLEDGVSGSSIKPDSSCFNRLLQVYNRLGDEVASETLYNDMLTNDRRTEFVDSSTFCIMMDIFHKSKHTDSAEKCLKVLNDFKIVASASTSIIDHQKITFCFNSSISKLCKTKNPIHINNACNLLMARNSYSMEWSSIDIIHFNMVLSSLLHVPIIDPCTKSLQILQHMRQNRDLGHCGPDTISYTNVIQIWLKYSRNYQEKIIELFEEMDRTEGFVFDATLFDVYLNSLHPGAHSKTMSYAKQIFGRMRQLNHQKKISMTATSCNILLKALSSSADDCHDTLLLMVDDFKKGTTTVLPDRVGFNTVIQALSSVKSTEAWVKADKLLSLMIALNNEYPTRNCGPDNFTVSALLSVIINSDRSEAGVKADALITRLCTDPDRYVYNRHLSAWAKSSSEHKVPRVMEILQQSILSGKADLVSYNTALNAFAYSSISNIDEPLHIYNDLCSRFKPDDVTFTTMVRVISLCRDSSRKTTEMMRLFTDYCQRGIVTQAVLKSLKTAVPSALHRKEIFKHSLEGSIDRNWSRNINGIHH